MRLRNQLMSLVLLPVLAFGCAGPAESGSTGENGATTGAPAEDKGAVLADVGGVKVYASEFEAAAARKTPADGQSLTLEERKEVLQKLVEEKALYQEAKKKGVDQDPKVQKVMINTLLRQEVYAGVRNADISDEELQKYFEEHKAEFVVPEKAQIKRIFIRVSEKRSDADAKKLAEELRGKVKADPSKFSEVATEHSEDPYKRRGGDLGFIAKDGKPGIDQAVVDKAFALQTGEVSDVFEAAGGYNIVMVENRREGVERSFDQMRSSVLRRVKNDKYRELYDTYVADIAKNYTTQVFEDELMKVKVEPGKKGPGMPGPMGGPMAIPGGMEEPGGEPEGLAGGEEGKPAPR